jgi:hypothetical protein
MSSAGPNDLSMTSNELNLNGTQSSNVLKLKLAVSEIG